MQIEVILLANSFFLLIVLIILVAIFFQNSDYQQSPVKEDLKKIKEQISGNLV